MLDRVRVDGGEMTTMSSRTKQILILVGPKGAGKTHVGGVLEKHLKITFLSVEKLGMEKLSGSPLTGDDLVRESFRLEEIALDQILSSAAAVSFETTGSSPHFLAMLEHLRARYSVQLIRIQCPLAICDQRIRTRDPRFQLPVSDEMIRIINEKAMRVKLDWALTIDNSGALSEQEIVDLIAPVLSGIHL